VKNFSREKKIKEKLLWSRLEAASSFETAKEFMELANQIVTGLKSGDMEFRNEIPETLISPEVLNKLTKKLVEMEDVEVEGLTLTLFGGFPINFGRYFGGAF